MTPAQHKRTRLRQPPVKLNPSAFAGDMEQQFVAALERFLSQISKSEVLKHLEGGSDGHERIRKVPQQTIRAAGPRQ